MSVERALHEHWSTYKPLTDLVPEARVFTGNAHGEPDLPYVTLERQGNGEVRRTSEGSILESVLMRFHVWDDDLDRGKPVADAILDHFNRLSCDWSLGKILDCKKTNYLEVQDEQGMWHLAPDYMVRVWQNSGT